MWRIMFSLLLLLTTWSNVIQAAAAPLDGRRYAIDLVATKDDPADHPPGSDIVVFADGNADCEQAAKTYGYSKGSYTATSAKGVVSFTFVMTSAKHGELTFKGQIKDKAITGTRTWSKPGKGTITHNFSGKQQ
jgi:hypothetical protein